MAARELEKVGDQLFDRLLLELDVRVLQQGREVVGAGSHPCILKIEDVETILMQHQVAAVVITVAEDARLGS